MEKKCFVCDEPASKHTAEGCPEVSAYTSFYCFELLPNAPTADEAEEIATPQGMRKRIERYSIHDTLTRSCMNIASANKCDDLDRMTILAFQALAENQRLKEQIEKHLLHHGAPLLMPNT